ncbi:MAG: hypothetical protein EXR69_14445 [Myxococcales bacterium]|nr:hypothetical protein [Myxococcales bacterium]
MPRPSSPVGAGPITLEPEVFAAFLARLDEDGSGALSSAEYLVAGAAGDFASTDSDGDGLVTVAELTVWVRVTTPRPEGLMISSLTSSDGAGGALPVQIGGPPVPGVKPGVDRDPEGMGGLQPRAAVREGGANEAAAFGAATFQAAEDGQGTLSPDWTGPAIAIALASVTGIAIGALLARKGRR